jgi:hypothetical protein
MLGALAVAALLTLSDPPGDARGQGTLTSPTATLFRQRETFDIRTVSVLDSPTFTLEIELGSAQETFPQAVLEFYLSDNTRSARSGAEALLPGSGMRLPQGQNWHYAVRIIGEDVAVFEGLEGRTRAITEASGAVLARRGSHLTLETALPLPRRFSLFGMSGSYDPFSPNGWRQVRETPSPWGFSGSQGVPVLDVVADTPELQQDALTRGVLPEIRASFREQGWLVVMGVGVAVSLIGFGVRIGLSQRAPPRVIVLPAPEGEAVEPASEVTLDTEVRTPLSPLSSAEIMQRLEALGALQRGEAALVGEVRETELEPVAH